MFAASKSGKPAAAGATTDPYFNSTTLLLETTGTNGQQNNTFLDSSTNNFTITRTGTPTQGTFTPFSQTGWSGYFDGSTDYLNAAANAVFAFGTAAWTVEAWVYVTTLQEIFVFDTRSSASTAGIGCRIDVSGALYYSGSANTSLTSTVITANTWNHIAWVYDGTTLTGYINGVSGGTATPSFNITQNNGVVGRAGYAASGYMAGYISNLRVVKGTAVYTAAFTPSTTPLTAISGTSLLTLQSNYFKDNSSNNFAITATGTPSIQAFSPFAPAAAYSTATVGGSGYFNGTTDYLSNTTSTAMQPQGTETFCVELWCRLISLPADAMVIEVPLANGIQLVWIAPNSFNTGVYGTYLLTYSFGRTPLNEWHQFVVTRDGSSSPYRWRLFVDGVLVATTTSTISLVTSSVITVASRTGAVVPTNCYISGLRISRGSIPTAYVTTSTTTGAVIFTPPTTPPTTTSEGATSGDVKLLLNATNAGIYDATAKNDVTTVSTAQASTTQSKFGGSSMLFNGTSDYLTAIDTPNLQLGTGNFTIEFWVYLAALGTNKGFISKGNTAASTGWEVKMGGGNQFNVQWTATSMTGTVAGTLNTWIHFALVRNGTATGNLKSYVNGALSSTSSVAVTDNFNQTDALRIGLDRAGSAFMNGYMDEVRITKGIARYTAAFTAPTAPFPVN
jgi:hypothetical protein